NHVLYPSVVSSVSVTVLCFVSFFFLMLLRPPRFTLFPYTTLFRSVGFAHTTGEILIQSDGTPWRPLVHVEDICRAFLAVLRAPRELVHNEAFNVGRTEENYQIRELAEMVAAALPGCTVKYAARGGPDPRCYRVDCSKLAATLPELQPEWTVRRGIGGVWTACQPAGL